jgi:ankyrin repeat protein
VDALIDCGAKVNDEFIGAPPTFLYVFPVNDANEPEEEFGTSWHFRPDIAKRLISAGVKLDKLRVRDEPLVCFLAHTSSDLLSDFVNLGADVNLKNRSGETPLMIAAEYGEVNAVNTLLRRGAITTERTNDGWTAIMLAAAGLTGNYVITQADRAISRQMAQSRAQIIDILHPSKELIEEKNNEGDSAIILAAKNEFNFGYLIGCLLAKGVDKDAKSHLGNSVLWEAIDHFNFEGAKTLISTGANVNALGHFSTTDPKRTILRLAIEKADPQLIQSISRSFPSYGEIAHEVIDLILRKVINVDQRGDGGLTAMMDAVMNDDAWTTKRLLEAGANIDLKDDDGDSPRSLAERRKNSEVLAVLSGHVSATK